MYVFFVAQDKSAESLLLNFSKMICELDSNKIKDAAVTSAGPDDEVWRRIEELKQRTAKSVQPPKQFEYDPDQPLHLPGNKLN